MPLSGKRIVVTRPRELAQGLAALIAQAGGEPLLFPTIEIRDAEDPAPARALLARLHEFDLAVFVSPSAVRKAFELAAGREWPARLRVAAAARELGLRAPVLAGPSDAEMLAALVAYFGGAK